MLRWFKKIVPARIFRFLAPLYHISLAFVGAVLYRFPSRKLKVIGVTGTDGKSTTVRMIGAVLEAAGFRVAWVSTIDCKIGERVWPNELQTMPGRLFLQQFLRQAVNAKCHYAVLEVSSEGVLQFRHRFIEFDTVVLTNVTPEHIERHGSFENYRQAKLELFRHLMRLRSKGGKKTMVVNLDDSNHQMFVSLKAHDYWGFSIKPEFKSGILQNVNVVKPKASRFGLHGIQFVYDGETIQLSLLGEFNLANALAALCVGLSQGIAIKHIKRGLESIRSVPGRLEFIDFGQPFGVVVDFALTPNALEKVYRIFENSRIISVFGSAGGERDRWKRPVLGELASRFCDYVILTNDDPYDENPHRIINDIARGIENLRRREFEKRQTPKKSHSGKGGFIPRSYEKIIDRRQAIHRALELAKKNDVVLITGKGCEAWIYGPQGTKIPWDDRKVAREELAKLGYNIK